MTEDSVARVVRIYASNAGAGRDCGRESSSSPGPGANTFDRTTLFGALEQAYAQGYNVAEVVESEGHGQNSLDLLAHARSLGMRTVSVNSGRFALGFSSRLALRSLGECCDLIIAHIAGPREIHDQFHGRQGAFDELKAGLKLMRDRDMDFGLSHVLTQANLPHLRWLADFAVEHRARLLRVTSSVAGGQRADGGREAGPDGFSRAIGYVELLQHAAARIGRGRGFEVAIDIDLVRSCAAADEVDVFLRPDGPPAANSPFADRVSPLVFDEVGVVRPWRRDFPESFAVAQLGRECLDAGIERWSRVCQEPFAAVCRRAHRRVVGDDAPPFFNWHDEVVAAALSSRRHKNNPLGVATSDSGGSSPALA